MANGGGKTTLPSWAPGNPLSDLGVAPKPAKPPVPKAGPVSAPKRTVAKATPTPKPVGAVRQPGEATVTTAKPSPSTSYKPFFQGQKPDHFETHFQQFGKMAPGPGHFQPAPVRVPVYVKPKAGAPLQTVLGGAPRGKSLGQSQADLAKVYAQNHPVGQEIIAGIANSVPGVSLAKGIRDNNIHLGTVANEALNDVTSGLMPAGKVAGILGGLGGLRKAQSVVEAAKATEGAKAVESAANGFVGSRNAEIASQIEHTATPTGEFRGHAPSVSGRPEDVRTPGMNGNGNPPRVPTANGSSHPLGPTNPGDVVKALKGAGKVRNEQNALYSEEWAKRIPEAQALYHAAGGGEAGHRAALSALSGALPKLQFTGGKNLNPDDIPALFQHIQDHPDLGFWEQLRARNALLKVFNGTVPQHNEIKLLTKAFGEDAKSLVGTVPFWKQAKMLPGEILNVPRALMASFDLSAPFRQALVAGTTHPVLFARNFKPMLQAFKSEDAYKAIMDDIVSRPNFKRYQKSGLAITDLEGGLTTREEQWFGENLAEKIPVVGHGVRASGRAYVGFLNKMRSDIFDSLVNDAVQQGRNPNDEKMLHDIAKAVNSATGRGHGPQSMQKILPHLNSIFFSPRLLMSRLDYMNPVNYTRLDPVARKEYLKGALSLVGTVGTVLSLAKLAGAKVNTDPLNADFAKIKIGNTRIDILGGFQQPIRLLTQLEQGKITSSTTGKTLHLGPEGPGHLSRFDIGLRFLESKLAPVPSFVTDVSKGTQFGGGKLNWGFTRNNPAFQRMVPLLLQDSLDIKNNKGPGPKGLGAAIGAYGLGAFGVGLQTYGVKKSGSTFTPLKSKGKRSGLPGETTLPSWSSSGNVNLPAWTP